MRALCEFRILEEFASLLFAPNEGVCLGDTIRKIIVAQDDPRYQKVGEIHKRLRAEGKFFFLYSKIWYKYTRRELEVAELFNLKFTSYFEPVGEECGAKYDYSVACHECGMPRTLVGGLVLDLRKSPKTKDIASTIANDEWIVTQRLAELLVNAQLTGFELQRVRHKAQHQFDAVDLRKLPSGRELIRRGEALGFQYESAEFGNWLARPQQDGLFELALSEQAKELKGRAQRGRRRPPSWYHLIVTSKPVSCVPPTQFGNDPFDDDLDGKYKCPMGHCVGLNVLSEISVAREEWDGSDIVQTRELIGSPRAPGVAHGVRVPSPQLLISPRFRDVLLKNGIKGYQTDVAHLK